MEESTSLAPADWRPSPGQLVRMYRLAVTAYPEECCGLLSRDSVTACRNAVDDRPVAGAEGGRTRRTGFALAARDVLLLARSHDGPDPVLAIFHSHPDVGAYFSDEDQRHALVEGRPAFPVDHFVIDARRGQVGGARRFRYDPATGHYEAAEVYGCPRLGPTWSPNRTEEEA